MTWIDWTVLMGTLTAIVGYGTWKTRQQRTLSAYLKGDNSMKWWTIGLSVMATQASAITFLSTPGQAYESGMGFVQFYFGLPLAMVVISAAFIPRYYGLKVFTAYEYLENRFGLPTRLFTALLFLISRGLAAGITIYAPAIVLSSLLGWNLWLTNVIVGVLVIVYTVSGGTKAVSITQKWQMAVIFTGMFLAFFLILNDLPEELSFAQTVDIAGMLGKMEIVDTSFDPKNRYTLWTGLLGGFFLALSYFGTDQSQVQRYLGGKNMTESRLGLLFNGLLKIPMQFFILFVGILVFVFYQFHTPPAFFNQPGKEAAYATEYAGEIKTLETEFEEIHAEKKELLNAYIAGDAEAQAQIVAKEEQLQKVRTEIKEKIHEAAPNVETRDTDYVFLTFILNHLPSGVVGLLLAVILSAAMSSTAGELNALASTTYIDYYQRLGKREPDEAKQVRISKLLTAGWGVLAIIIALSAQLYENLIQLVNVLGSLFYGTILGIFVVAFFLRFVKGQAVLIAGFIGQGTVVLLHVLTVLEIIELGYLWYNVIGCGVVVIFAIILQQFISEAHEPEDQYL
ncbi:MAG: sodium:solute symporter [Leptolyngbya sp. SIO3F4]|nr:sodium:solute symporter [Leptolyngbya sp. SIO3F4]